jgi:hypothetical protein
MTASSWLKSAVVIAAGAVFAVVVASPSAYSRSRHHKKATPTPTETPTPTATATPQVKVWNFDQDKAGESAPDWQNLVDSWQVIPDATAPSQPNTYGLPPGRTLTTLLHLLNYYPMAVVKDPTEYGDFTLEASFKSAGGRFDCSGGLLFRYVDAQNFYVVAAGCPSDYFQFSRMYKGKLEMIKQQVVPTDRDIWYKIRVEAQGNRFTFYDNDKQVFDADDSKIAKGRIGLWARDDSQARFDNVTLTLPIPTAEATPGAAEGGAAAGTLGAPAPGGTTAAPAPGGPPSEPPALPSAPPPALPH